MGSVMELSVGKCKIWRSWEKPTAQRQAGLHYGDSPRCWFVEGRGILQNNTEDANLDIKARCLTAYGINLQKPLHWDSVIKQATD